MNLLEDPLDSEDFDPVQYINEKFPTEASLEDLDDFINNIGLQVSGLDEEISKAVQSQSVVGKQASEDITDARTGIEDLFGKINDIKTKALQSEKMVHEICADIKQLDCAKNHLQTTITSLNRLQMLINAVNQLEMLAMDYEYRDVANLLDAVKQFITHFEQYVHIPVIADIYARVDRIKDNLTEHVNETFLQVAQRIETVADVELILSDLPGGMKSLSDSCAVVDSLGTKVRKELLDGFVKAQLVPYEKLFGIGNEFYAIDHVERRWSWFKRQVKWIESKFSSVFPPHWRLLLRLCLEFTEVTKMHLVALLTELDNRDNIDVNAILKALQSALRFEKDMNERFNVAELLRVSHEKEAHLKKSKAMEVENEMKLKKDDKLMYIPTDHNALNEEDESESGFLQLAHNAIVGGISGVFDQFLGCYVLLEKQNLEEMIMKLSQGEDTTSDGAEGLGGNSAGKLPGSFGNVYGSSSSMFVFIKNSIKRCISLTNGQTFFSLSKEFKTCLHQYMELLRNRCPLGTGQPPVYRVPPGGEVGLSYIVNTAEYCAEVIPQLEQMVSQNISATFSSKVDFSSEVDAFMDLIAYCIKILVSGILERLEPSFRTMQLTNWGAVTSVEEESEYLHQLNQVLVEALPLIRETLSSTYFNTFCTKLSTEILQRYLDIITKQKRISEMATQQLLLDTYNIKTVLLQLHQLGPMHSEGSYSNANAKKNKASPPMYLKLVNAKTAQIETILKLVATPEEMLLERFRLMWPDGQPTDLQMLMGLKGTKRNDQQAILEMMGLTATTKIINKTSTLFGGIASASASSTDNIAVNSSNTNLSPNQQSCSSNFPNNSPANPQAFSTSTSYYAASAAAASISMASSSMRNLTQDIASSTRSAVGNLKWSSTSSTSITSTK